MKFAVKSIVVAVVVVSMLSFAAPSYAQDAGAKLWRGTVNILTGWIELPKTVYDTSVEDNALMGATVGVVKGLWMSVLRTGVGVYEVVTFPIPVPEYYDPVMEPEFVLDEY